MSYDPWQKIKNREAAKIAAAARIGSGPIEQALRAPMRAFAEFVDDYFNGSKRPKELGFILLTFPFGDKDGRCNYISNVPRDDVKLLLKEQLAYFEGMPDNIKTTKQ